MAQFFHPDNKNSHKLNGLYSCERVISSDNDSEGVTLALMESVKFCVRDSIDSVMVSEYDSLLDKDKDAREEIDWEPVSEPLLGVIDGPRELVRVPSGVSEWDVLCVVVELHSSLKEELELGVGGGVTVEVSDSDDDEERLTALVKVSDDEGLRGGVTVLDRVLDREVEGVPVALKLGVKLWLKDALTTSVAEAECDALALVDIDEDFCSESDWDDSAVMEVELDRLPLELRDGDMLSLRDTSSVAESVEDID